MTDPHTNEFTLLKKIVIFLILLNFATAMFAFFMGGTLGLSCTGAPSPSNPLCKLQIQQKAINGTATNIGMSFSNSTNIVTPVNSSVLGAPILNFIIAIPNFIVHLGTLLYNGLLLLGQGIYLVLTVLFQVIPSIFASPVLGLGVLGNVFGIVFILIPIMIIGLVIYLILNRVPQVH
jgi:hypothetical protein